MGWTSLFEHINPLIIFFRYNKSGAPAVCALQIELLNFLTVLRGFNLRLPFTCRRPSLLNTITDTMTITYAGSGKNTLISLIIEIQKHSENVNIENNTLVLRKYVNIFITSLLQVNNAVTTCVVPAFIMQVQHKLFTLFKQVFLNIDADRS